MKHTNTSYFTMVAVDEQSKPLQVPGLILQNRLEIRRFLQSFLRKELKKRHKQEEEHMKATYTKEEFLTLLKDERCHISAEL